MTYRYIVSFVKSLNVISRLLLENFIWIIFFVNFKYLFLFLEVLSKLDFSSLSCLSL